MASVSSGGDGRREGTEQAVVDEIAALVGWQLIQGESGKSRNVSNIPNVDLSGVNVDRVAEMVETECARRQNVNTARRGLNMAAATTSLQDALVELVTWGMDIADRTRLRDLWLLAGSAAKASAVSGDPVVEDARARELQRIMQEAEVIAVKYARELNVDTPDARRDATENLAAAFFIGDPA